MLGGYIYGLFAEDKPDEIRYIGVSKDVKSRLAQHIREAKKGKKVRHKNSWIRSVLASGGTVQAVTLAGFYTIHDAYGSEDDFIVEYRSRGHRLTNMAPGGSAGCLVSPEEARRLSSTPEALERSRLAARKRWDATPIENRTPYNKGFSKYQNGERPVSTYTGKPRMIHGSDEHREHHRKETTSRFEKIKADAELLEQYKASRAAVGKLVSPKKKQEWDNLSEEAYKLRCRNMALGKRYNKAKRLGWVLEITPVEHTCTEPESGHTV